MRKIGFIGAFDKIDFILYIAKILTEMGQKVLVVDGTVTQKARYIVPSIEKTKYYITTFEDIDVAVGLRSIEEIKSYLDIPESGQLPYDVVFIDTDSMGAVQSYDIKTCERIYFATSLDMYSIKKGVESLSMFSEKVVVNKIIFSRNFLKEEDEYLNYLSSGSNIVWNEEVLTMPYDCGDLTPVFENQRVSKIKFKNFSATYKDGLVFVVEQLMGKTKFQEIKKIFKKIEKGA